MAYERLDGGERAPWWHTVALILLVGFCMIMSAVCLLSSNAQPGEDQIAQALEGNLCRCTGYTNIVESVQRAARRAARFFIM